MMNETSSTNATSSSATSACADAGADAGSGPPCKFSRSMSMVEMREMSIIRELEDNLNTINQEEQERSITVEDDDDYEHENKASSSSASRDEGRRCSTSIDSILLEGGGFRRTASSADIGAMRFQQGKEWSLKDLVLDEAHPSTFSIIPEESEVLDDPTLSVTPIVDDAMDMDMDMDTSRHRYNLGRGLDLDDATSKKAATHNLDDGNMVQPKSSSHRTEQDDMDTSRHRYSVDFRSNSLESVNEKLPSVSDDMDHSRHSYNLGLGLDLDAGSNNTCTFCEDLDCSSHHGQSIGLDLLGEESTSANKKPSNDVKILHKNEWQFGLHGLQRGEVLKPKSKNDAKNESSMSIDHNLDASIRRYKLDIALDPNKAVPTKPVTSKRDDQIISSSTITTTSSITNNRKESPQSVKDLDLTESDNCTKIATSSPKKQIRKSRSLLLLPSLLRKGHKQQQPQPQLSKKSKSTMVYTDTSDIKLKSILKSNSMIDLNRQMRSNSSISDDTADLSTEGSVQAAGANATSPNKMKRVTSFSKVEIREYNITLGDNPGGQGGPPVSLSWEYNRNFTQVVDVDLYEETRPPRRSKSEMYMDNGIRTFRLMREQGFSLQDMRKAAKKAAEIRKQRQKTAKRLNQRETIVNRVSSIFPPRKKSSPSE